MSSLMTAMWKAIAQGYEQICDCSQYLVAFDRKYCANNAGFEYYNYKVDNSIFLLAFMDGNCNKLPTTTEPTEKIAMGLFFKFSIR